MLSKAKEQVTPNKDLRINASPWEVAQKLMKGGAPKQAKPKS